MVCILGMGDCGSRQEVKKKFNMEAVNENIYSQSSKNSQKVSATSTNIAQFTIEIENMNEGCPVDVAQSISSETISDATQVIENISTMTNEVTTQLQQAASEELEAVGGFFTTTKNRQSVETEMNQAIKNVVKRTFEVENLQQAAANSINVAEGKVIIKNCNAPIDVSQDLVSSTIATAVIDSLTDNLIKDEQLNKIVQDANTKAEASSKGLTDFFTGDAMWVWISLSIVLCVLLVVVMKVALSPGGQEGMKAAAASR